MLKFFADKNFSLSQLVAIIILLIILWFSISGSIEDHKYNKKDSPDINKIHKRISRIELYIASIVVVNLLKSVYTVANGN